MFLRNKLGSRKRERIKDRYRNTIPKAQGVSRFPSHKLRTCPPFMIEMLRLLVVTAAAGSQNNILQSHGDCVYLNNT